MGNKVLVDQFLKIHSAISFYWNTLEIIYLLFKHFHWVIFCCCAIFTSINVKITFERTKRHNRFPFYLVRTYCNNRMGTIVLNSFILYCSKNFVLKHFSIVLMFKDFICQNYIPKINCYRHQETSYLLNKNKIFT